MSDARETAATIFDRTAKLASTLMIRASGDVGIALELAARISNTVAAIIRALGIEDAGKAIAELGAGKDEGVITDDDLVNDDASVEGAISDLFEDNADESKR